MVHGRAPGGRGALQPLRLVWPENKWLQQPGASVMLWYKGTLLNRVHGSGIGRSWLLSFRAKLHCKNQKKAMSLAEDKQTRQSKVNPFKM